LISDNTNDSKGLATKMFISLLRASVEIKNEEIYKIFFFNLNKKQTKIYVEECIS
jgi:hypothetical protein